MAVSGFSGTLRTLTRSSCGLGIGCATLSYSLIHSIGSPYGGNAYARNVARNDMALRRLLYAYVAADWLNW